MASTPLSTVRIPTVLADRIDAYREADGGVYLSRAELVKAAVLEWLERREPRRVVEAIDEVPA